MYPPLLVILSQVILQSIGKLGEEENAKHSKAICDKVAELGVGPTRVHILFQDVPGYAVGTDGTACKVKYGL